MKIIKWIVGVVMILVLIGGAGSVATANISLSILPKNVDELDKVRVTIKTLLIGPNVQFLTPQEYPLQFEIPGTSPVEGVVPMAVGPEVKASDAKTLIRIGDNADVYLKRETIKELQDKAASVPPVIIGYGITLADGKVLSDPNEVIAGTGYHHLKKVGYEMVGVPILYFLFLISCGFLRRKKRA